MSESQPVTACGVVPVCGYCGRPVRESDLTMLNGNPMPYHIACTYPPASPPQHGCVCPAGSEATCQGFSCPRRGMKFG